MKQKNNDVRHLFTASALLHEPVRCLTLTRYHGHTGTALMHRHSLFQILAAARGELQIITVGKTYAVHAGEALLIPAGQPHAWHASQSAQVVQILLSPNTPAEFAHMGYLLRELKSPCLLRVGESPAQIAALVLRESKESGMGGALLLFGTILRLCGTILREWEQTPSFPGTPARHPGLVRALRKIESDPACRISLRELADEAHLSVSRFCELFREEFGMPPGEYTIRRRMENIRAALLNSSLEIKEILERFDMKSESYFNRKFKALYGMPPSRFRKNACSS